MIIVEKKEKALRGQYFRDVQAVVSDQSWDWLKKGRMKRETESVVCAAQDQALNTNAIKSKIYKENISPLCRLCNKHSETVMHLLSGCENLAQKRLQEKAGLRMHWLLCCKYDIESSKNWHEHKAKSIEEHEKTEILWDVTIQTDRVIEARRSDIVVIDKQNLPNNRYCRTVRPKHCKEREGKG